MIQLCLTYEGDMGIIHKNYSTLFEFQGAHRESAEKYGINQGLFRPPSASIMQFVFKHSRPQLSKWKGLTAFYASFSGGQRQHGSKERDDHQNAAILPRARDTIHRQSPVSQHAYRCKHDFGAQCTGTCCGEAQEGWGW